MSDPQLAFDRYRRDPKILISSIHSVLTETKNDAAEIKWLLLGHIHSGAKVSET
jgi:hypothetical protein